MKKIRNLVIGGIESKVFNLILVTVLLIVAAFMCGFVYQNRMLSEVNSETSRKQQESITEITGTVMEKVVEENLESTTELEAAIANEMFRGLKNRVEMIGDYATKLFNDPDVMLSSDYAAPDPAQNGQVVAQLILADGVKEETVADRVGIAANMSDLMISLFGASAETNSCFVALPEGAFLVVDDRSATKFNEVGTPIDYDARTRIWY